MAEELPELLLPDAAAWRAWLVDNCTDERGVRLVLAKKGFTEPTTLRYDEALMEALCFGWIDGQVKRRDEATMWQRFTPRRKRSIWSQRNVEHVARLTEAGLMQPTGLAAVEAAKADGRWDRAYAGPASIEMPADLAAAVQADAAAAATWQKLTSQNRYAIMHRLLQVKGAQARARRIAQFVEMLARGETVHPQRGL